MSAVRTVFTEYDLGQGWGRLHELARLRKRKPQAQILHLVLFALDRDRAGEDVELNQDRLEALLAESAA